jgi:hypothetical protein
MAFYNVLLAFLVGCKQLAAGVKSSVLMGVISWKRE